MTISEILWEAACEISDGEEFACHAIRWVRFGNLYYDKSQAELFFKNLLKPRSRDTEKPSNWNGDAWLSDISMKEKENQNIRFMALLFTREIALSEGE